MKRSRYFTAEELTGREVKRAAIIQNDTSGQETDLVQKSSRATDSNLEGNNCQSPSSGEDVVMITSAVDSNDYEDTASVGLAAEWAKLITSFPWDQCRRVFSTPRRRPVDRVLMGLSYDWEHLLKSSFVDARVLVNQWLHMHHESLTQEQLERNGGLRFDAVEASFLETVLARALLYFNDQYFDMLAMAYLNACSTYCEQEKQALCMFSTVMLSKETEQHLDNRDHVSTDLSSNLDPNLLSCWLRCVAAEIRQLSRGIAQSDGLSHTSPSHDTSQEHTDGCIEAKQSVTPALAPVKSNSNCSATISSLNQVTVACALQDPLCQESAEADVAAIDKKESANKSMSYWSLSEMQTQSSSLQPMNPAKKMTQDTYRSREQDRYSCGRSTISDDFAESVVSQSNATASAIDWMHGLYLTSPFRESSCAHNPIIDAFESGQITSESIQKKLPYARPISHQMFSSNSTSSPPTNSQSLFECSTSEQIPDRQSDADCSFSMKPGTTVTRRQKKSRDKFRLTFKLPCRSTENPSNECAVGIPEAGDPLPSTEDYVQYTMLVPLKGIDVLTNGRYRVQLNAFMNEKKKFSRNSSDFFEAIWILEIALLISDAPKLLSELQRIGNYNTLCSIGEKFGSFSTPFGYYVELGRRIISFYDSVEYFNEDLITIAIKNFDALKPALRGSTAQLPRHESSILPCRLTEVNSNSIDTCPQSSPGGCVESEVSFLHNFSRGLSLEEQGRSCLFYFRQFLATASKAAEPWIVSVVKEERSGFRENDS